jgi:hypothetical protein
MAKGWVLNQPQNLLWPEIKTGKAALGKLEILSICFD